MRNVVTLSDLPLELHDWLKDEAKRLTAETGEKTALCHVVVLACQQYRARVEAETTPAKEVVHVTN